MPLSHRFLFWVLLLSVVPCQAQEAPRNPPSSHSARHARQREGAPADSALVPFHLVGYTAQGQRVEYDFAQKRPNSLVVDKPITDTEYRSELFGPGTGAKAEPSPAERALIEAIRSVAYSTPEGKGRPNSTDGEMDPTLCDIVRKNVRAMAHFKRGGHHGWGEGWESPIGKGKIIRLPDRRQHLINLGYANLNEIEAVTSTEAHFNDLAQQRKIIFRVTGEKKPYSALTYPQKLQVQAQFCVDSWLVSKEHKKTLDRRPLSGRYCYSMARADDGVFYCAGIVD